MRVGVEIGIDQVGELAALAMDLDQVGALDLAEVGPAAALVDVEQRAEGAKSECREPVVFPGRPGTIRSRK